MSEDPNQPTNSRQDSKANEPPLIEPTVTKLKKRLQNHKSLLKEY